VKTVIKVEDLGKLYRLGEVGTGTLSHDLNRWWHRIRGKEDPFLKIGEVNDRTKKSDSDYVWALHHVNFELFQGEVLGVIGKNGAGKSTLLKLLSRVTAPSRGVIKTRGRIASLLEVGTGFHPELTGRDNVYLNGTVLGMTKAEIQKKFDEIISFSGVERYIDTPVKRYSSGMLVRLGFAVAAHLEPEILIVDEVLAVGDTEFQNKCLGKMNEVSQSGRTIIFVSHNMQAVSQLCTRAILLEKGTLTFDGGVKDAVKKYLADSIVISGASIDYSAHKDRKGNGKIQVQHVELFNRTDNTVSNCIYTDGELCVRIRLKSHEATRNVSMAFHMYKSDETIFANVGNIDSDFYFEPFTGERTFEIIFPKMNLYPDTYRVGISIGTKDWSECYDQIIPLFEFVVIEGAEHVKRKLLTSNGFVYFTPTWSVIS
jgi:lipopolysaccharide transport system ATP-binding protein